MKTIVIASRKGGVGKTTLSAHLGVAADSAGDGPVVLIDTDEQASLAQWWDGRASPAPLFAVSTPQALGAKLAELAAAGIRLAIIDTPPQAGTLIRAVMAHADLVLVPTRPSPLDLRAVGATIALAEAEGKPMVFVVNGAINRARITADAAVALSQHGTVAPVTLYNRTALASAMIDGRVAQETEPDGKGATEVAELWQYVSARLRVHARKEART